MRFPYDFPLVTSLFTICWWLSWCCSWVHASVGINLYMDESLVANGGAYTATDISLAIVFDSTGSMGNDLRQVKLGARRILNKHLKTGQKSYIQDFVLVQVHDPDVGPAKRTTSPREFNRFLDAIYTQGGGDCPEMTITGIQQALETAKPNSLVYVFTDSSAKDYKKTPEVLSLIQKKQSQVVFVLTGYCNSTDEPGFKAYQEIATVSSGQVYIIEKGQVKQFMEVVENAVQSRKVHILQQDTRQAGSKSYAFPVDSHLTQIAVQVTNYKTNDSINVRIRDPEGQIMTNETGLSQLMKDVPSVFVGSIDRPKTGIWTIEVSTENNWHSVRVTGISEVDFIQGFAALPVYNNLETARQPIKGVKNYMMANVTGNYLPGLISEFAILTLNGSGVVRLPVNTTDFHQVYISAYPFDAGSSHYYLKMSGRDSRGFELQRYSKIAILPREPRAVTVTCPAKIEAKRGETITIACQIDSEIPFTTKWTKNNAEIRGNVDPGRQYSVPSSVSYVINNANEESAGVYGCQVVTFGVDSSPDTQSTTRDETVVSVLPPPPRVVIPRNASVEPNANAELLCSVFSQAEGVEIRWFRRQPRYEIRNSRRFRIETKNMSPELTSSKLTIIAAAESDTGEYLCEAQHRGGEMSLGAFVNIHVKPKVIKGEELVSFKSGEDLTLNCRVDGVPAPKIQWRFKDSLLSENPSIRIENGYMESRLTIKAADQTNSGDYVCSAENSAGIDSQKIQAQFLELPIIEDYSIDKVAPLLGENIRLRCSARGQPFPMIRWEFNGSPVSESTNIRINSTTGELVISRVDKTMEGQWRCVAENAAGTVRKDVTLNISFPPTIIDFQREVSVEYGQNATLQCLTNGRPKPEITWFIGVPGQQFIPVAIGDKYFLTPEGSLIINEITLEEKGFYTCRARNIHGSQDESVNVSVKGTRIPIISFSQPKQKAVEGAERKILTCIVLEALPPAIVTWMKDNRELTSDNSRYIMEGTSLIIRGVQVEDEGVYSCIAKNLVGKAKFDIELDVQTKPIISGKKREFLEVTQGQKVELVCEAKSDPPSAIEWRLNGKPLTPDVTYLYSSDATKLTIYSVNAKDAGTYTCTASNEIAADVKEIQMKVKTPPTIAKEGPNEFEVQKGDGIQLSCVILGGEPQPKISWYKNGQPINPADSTLTVSPDGNTLDIRSADRETSGSYECRSENDAGSDSRFYEVIVIVPPTSENKEVITIYTDVGRTLTLNCKVDGYPMPKKQWLWKNQTIDLNNNPFGVRPERQESSDLYIPNMKMELLGSYTCLATNKGGSTSIRYELIILKPPKIVNWKNSAVVVKGNPITLSCHNEGSPKPKIEWLFKNNPISDSLSADYRFLGDDKGTLIVSNAEERHGGIYTCVASNPAGRDVKDTTVIVFERDVNGGNTGPAIPNNITVGGNITFSCVMNSTPPAEIKWYKDDKEITTALEASRYSVSRDGATLTIYNLAQKDAGQFKCLAVNIPGNWGKNFTLFVEVSPLIIRNLSSPPKSDVMLGAEFLLRCWAEGSPKPTYEWFREGGEPLLPSKKIKFEEDGKAVRIRPAGPEDSGAYNCRAKNSAGVDNAKFMVNVMKVPIIFGSLERETPEFPLNQSATLFCNATGFPPPKITWKYDLNPDTTSQITLRNNNAELHIATVTRLTIVRYICEAKNLAGSSQKIFDPIIVYAPFIRHPDEERKRWVLKGGNVQLACLADGAPDATIEWFKNGESLQLMNYPRLNITNKNTQLQLFNTEEEDSGTYKCVATNKIGQDKRIWTVDIMVRPKIILSNLDRREATHPLGSSLSLFCIAEGKPMPTVQWTKDGVAIDTRRVEIKQDGKQIDINLTVEEDSGRYSCRAENQYGLDSLFIDVKITYGPKIDGDIQKIIYIDKTIGSSALLECPVVANPPPEIYWSKDGKPLNPLPFRMRTHNNNRTLEVISMKAEDAGRYTCTARNNYGELELIAIVSVGAPARIDRARIRSEYIVKVGEELFLPCPATGSPQPTVEFLRANPNENMKFESVTVSGSSSWLVSQTRQGMSLTRITKDHGGLYMCNASNPVGWDSEEFRVVVQSPPEFDSSNTQTEVQWFINQTRSLECMLKGVADPPAKVTWERHGAPLVSSGNVRISSDGSTMTVLSVQQFDAGEYKCWASNDVAKISQKFTALVYVPPRFYTPLRLERIEAIENNTVQMSCEASGQPRPRITWYRNEREILSSGDIVMLPNNLEQRIDPNLLSAPDAVSVSSRYVSLSAGQILQMSSVQLGDAGLYSCTATNGGGTIERKFQLAIITPPKIQKTIVGGGSESHRTQENVAIILDCRVIDMKTSQAVISWFKDGQPVLMEDNEFYLISDEGQKLTILQPGSNEMGRYQCRVKNKAGEDTQFYDVKVLAPPRFPSQFIRYRERIPVQVGNPISLACPATGAPPPVIMWFRDGIPLSTYNSLNVAFGEAQRSLELPAVQQKDGGEYRCVASNEAGNVTKIYDLRITMPALVRLDKTEVRERQGSTFSVLCSAQGYPTPTIEWKREGLGIFRLGTSGDPKSGLLTITDAVGADSGRYTCSAYNSLSEDSKSVDIVITERPTLLVPQQIYRAKIGDELLLKCQATGTQPIIIQWSLPVKAAGFLSSPSSQLTQSIPGQYRLIPEQGLLIERITADHNGRFRCSASNEAGFQDANIRVEVMVAPKLARQANYTIVGRLNSFKQIECKIDDGVPSPTIQWERNGVVLAKQKNYYTTTDSGLFVFNSLKEEDEGDLICVAKNDAGEDRQTFRIVVEVPPRVTLPVSTLGYEGQSATITCQVEGRPPPEITWQFNGQPIQVLGSRFRQDAPNQITIYDLQSQDAGNFFCIGRRPGQETVRAATYLTIFTKPKFTTTPGLREEAYEARWIQLSCIATGNPQPEITWFFNNAISLRTNPSTNGKGTLNLGPLGTQQSGTYTCVAKNEVGKTEYSFQFLVKSRPLVRVLQADEAIEERSTGVLRCEIKGEADSIVWMKDGLVLLNSSRVLISEDSRTIHIDNAVAADTGTYQCIATNPVGESQGEVHFVVRSKPVFTATPSNHSVNQGELVTMACEAEGYPQPAIEWYQNGKAIVLSKTHIIVRNGSLRILGVRPQDSGLYQCAASNPLGEIYSPRVVINVAVNGNWAAWSEWSTCSSTCGQGQSTRTRLCDNPSPENDGLQCVGNSQESTTCLSQFCPKDGGWSAWSTWTTCSRTCGVGLQQRSRMCDNPPPSNGGLGCIGEAMEDSMCDGNPPCPVHGMWSAWSSWSDCSVTCGSGGTQRKRRECDSPPAQNGGQPCFGRDSLVRACSASGGCPVNGGWSQWGSWTGCTRSCGGGQQRRNRLCTEPSPQFGGQPCSSSGGEQSQICNRQPCPVNGEWSNWSSWSSCSVNCQHEFGLHERIRTCTEPEPQHGGQWCRSGAGKEIRQCQGSTACKDGGGSGGGNGNGGQTGGGGGSKNDDWSSWSNWEPMARCPSTNEVCEQWRQGKLPNHGLLTELRRSRSCLKVESRGCVGSGIETKTCPIDLSGCVPLGTNGSIVGILNDKDIGQIPLKASWSPWEKKSHIIIELERVLLKDIPCLVYLNGIYQPLLWFYAYEVNQASNGNTTLTGSSSHFRLDGQAEFATGKIFKFTAHAAVLSPSSNNNIGSLQLQILVSGHCPIINKPKAKLQIPNFKETLVQMTPSEGRIYAYSSRYGRVDNTVEPANWQYNLTLGSNRRQFHTTQMLVVEDFSYQVNTTSQASDGGITMAFNSILVPVEKGCPKGFVSSQPWSSNNRDKRASSSLSSSSYCLDVNECKVSQENNCDDICENTIGGYRCRCSKGYRLHADGRRCIDEDECAGDATSTLCPKGQQCVNIPGSYRCLSDCPAGTRRVPGDPLLQCQDIDECREKPGICGIHQCINTYGTYHCNCLPGYKNVAQNCIDINECTEEDQHRCSRHELCINTAGSYRCKVVCEVGYRVATNGSSLACVDIDECAVGEAKCARDSHTQCINVPGSYKCQCFGAGLRYDSVEERCVDIDECEITNPPACSHLCSNVWGSYKCSCPPGMILKADKRTCVVNRVDCKSGFQWDPIKGCVDVDECRPKRGPSPCQYKCVNTYGGYRCDCPKGYLLSKDNSKCTDINECELSKPNHQLCGDKQICLNTLGNYTCVNVKCPPQYEFDPIQKTCEISCSNAVDLDCPRNSNAADTIQYVIVNLPGGQEGATVRVRVVNHRDKRENHCQYDLLDSSPGQLPISYRTSDGMIYVTTKSLNEQQQAAAMAATQDNSSNSLYYFVFRVKCYKTETRKELIFQNSFYIYVAISKYPF